MTNAWSLTRWGGVGLHAASFAQGFQYEHDVAVLEVAHASVDKLGAAAGGALGKVGLFEQCNAVSARCGVDCDTQAGGTAAHYDHIPDFSFFG